jgi:hypothetical protein
MLQFVKGDINDIVCTLTEKQTISNPYYLFSFTNDISGNSYQCIATDISTHKERFNEFEITEKESPDPLGGEIELAETGFYHYTIYQQNSATNLNHKLANGILEIGKMKVLASLSELPEFSVNETVVVFQP